MLRLRITVEHPLPGVALQVQRGKAGLLAPTRSSANSVSFDFVVRVGPTSASKLPRFLGEFTQGPVGERFVYVNSGQRAGQAVSCWGRRAKVPLLNITPAQICRVLADDKLILEARIAGLARDGGPLCASVPLLDGAWVVRSAR